MLPDEVSHDLVPVRLLTPVEEVANLRSQPAHCLQATNLELKISKTNYTPFSLRLAPQPPSVHFMAEFAFREGPWLAETSDARNVVPELSASTPPNRFQR
jgi:hypothetical protein